MSLRKIVRLSIMSVMTTLVIMMTLLTFDPGGAEGNASYFENGNNIIDKFYHCLYLHLNHFIILGPSFKTKRRAWMDNININLLSEPELCNNNEDVVVAVVHSHANNFQLRSSQRNAMKQSLSVKIKPIFVVFIDQDDNVNKQVDETYQ